LIFYFDFFNNQLIFFLSISHVNQKTTWNDPRIELLQGKNQTPQRKNVQNFEEPKEEVPVNEVKQHKKSLSNGGSKDQGANVCKFFFFFFFFSKLNDIFIYKSLFYF